MISRATLLPSLLLLMALCASGCRSIAPTADAERGRRLATVLGCTDCHGPDLVGHKVSHNDAIVVLYSANLTQALPSYTDQQLRTVLSTGVRPDGSRLWQMDAAPYAVLSDRDMADLVAFLRSLRPVGEPHPRIRTTPVFDEMVRKGDVAPASSTLSDDLAHPPTALGASLERGRYVARTACAGCHAPSLRGFQPAQAGDPPDLAVVASYSRADFQRFIHEGRGPDGRDVGEMGLAARKRFAALPKSDIDALYAYLTTWAKRRAVPQGD